MSKSASGGKSKKQGRNKVACAAYRVTGRRNINKAKRLMRALRRNPNDGVAAACLENLAGYADRARKEMRAAGWKGEEQNVAA